MSDFVCTYCLKAYANRSTYNKHISVCKVIHMCKEQDGNEYSMHQLTQMVKYLSFELETMKNQMNDMKLYNQRKARYMIDKVLERLYHPTQHFEDWCKTVAPHNIYTVREHSLPHALAESITKCDETDLPIYAFEEKRGIFYVYSCGQWRLMIETDWSMLIQQFRKKCTAEYLKLTSQIERDDMPNWINNLMHSTNTELSSMKSKLYSDIKHPMVMG